MTRTAKEYAEILKSVIKMQIGYITENPNYDESDYLQGQEQGLMIALDKIEASSFLLEE